MVGGSLGGVVPPIARVGGGGCWGGCRRLGKVAKGTKRIRGYFNIMPFIRQIGFRAGIRLETEKVHQQGLKMATCCRSPLFYKMHYVK